FMLSPTINSPSRPLITMKASPRSSQRAHRLYISGPLTEYIRTSRSMPWKHEPRAHSDSPRGLISALQEDVSKHRRESVGLSTSRLDSRCIDCTQPRKER